jgi:hypothetical protein
MKVNSTTTPATDTRAVPSLHRRCSVPTTSATPWCSSRATCPPSWRQARRAVGNCPERASPSSRTDHDLRGSRPPSIPPPTYDIFDPQYLLDPFPTIDEIRESGCPIAHTERWGGSWMPTRYADIVAIAQEHDVFTSRQILVTGPPDGQVPEGAYAGVAAPPISSDPPEHHWHRRLILPFFAPQAVAKYEPITRDAVQRADRQVHRQGRGRLRRRLRAADSRARHRHDAGRAHRHERHVHRLGARRAGERPDGPGGAARQPR